jgi:hypothetical protein
MGGRCAKVRGATSAARGAAARPLPTLRSSVPPPRANNSTKSNVPEFIAPGGFQRIFKRCGPHGRNVYSACFCRIGAASASHIDHNQKRARCGNRGVISGARRYKKTGRLL